MRAACLGLTFCLGLAWLSDGAAQTPDFQGSTRPPAPLGQLVKDSDSIVVLEVDKVERGQNLIIFKTIAALKGRGQTGPVRHYHEKSAVLAWAKPGRKAICFDQSGQAMTCIGNHWYYNWHSPARADKSAWDGADWAEGCRATYLGSVEKLREHVTAILAGREVVITAETPESVGDDRRLGISWPRDWLRGRKGRIHRIRAGLKVGRSIWADGGRSFVGWGVGGAEVVPALVRALRDPDVTVRGGAVEDLGQLGPLARPARGALRRLLEDPDRFLRLYAALALARIDPDARPDLTYLLAALQDRDPKMRRAAVVVLAELGARAEMALPDLKRLLRNDKDLLVRGVAAFALGEIAPTLAGPARPAATAVAALAEALERDEASPVRLSAARALLRFGPRAWPAVPALCGATRRRPGEWHVPDTALVAADVLTRLDPPPVEILAAELQGERSAVRLAFAAQLGEWGPRAWLAVPALQAALDEEDWDLCYRAARSLARIDRRSITARVVPALIKLTKDRDYPYWNAVWALGELGAAARAAVPDLVRVLQDGNGNPAGRWAAARALAKIGPAARAAVPALRKQLENKEDRHVQFLSALALWRIDRDKNAIPVLLAALRENPVGRTHILREIGPSAKAAAPALRKAIARADPSDRVWLTLALRRVEGKGPNGRTAGAARLLEQIVDMEDIDRDDWVIPIQSIDSLLQIDLGVLGEEDAVLREEAGNVLRLLLSDPNPIPALTRALKAPNLYARLVAALALSRLTPDRSEPYRVLAQIIEQRPTLLPFLAEPLASAGANARSAVPVLVKLLRHEHRAIYRLARHALSGIDPRAAKQAWNIAALGPTRPARGHDALWSELARGDAVRAYMALGHLACEGPPAVSFLGERLRLAAPVPPREIARHIADLDSDDFDTRERASAWLTKAAEQAAPALRKALAARPSREARRRIMELLEQLDPTRWPERRRALRAVAVLEAVATPEARALLRRLAGGAPDAHLTQEAKAALGRLVGRRMGSP